VDRDAGLALRWSRALILSAVVFGFGTAAHVSAGGLLPGAMTLLVAYAAVTLTAAALLGRPAGATRILALTVGGQTVVHGLLSATAGHRGGPADATGTPTEAPLGATRGLTQFGADEAVGRRTGTFFDAYQASVPAGGRTVWTVPDPLVHLVDHLTSDAPMMALHTLAAVVVAGWLVLGERALWRLLTAARRLLVPLFGVLVSSAAVVDRPNRGLLVLPVLPAARARLFARVVPRRGPPLLPST
jgi:hypothetical protein